MRVGRCRPVGSVSCSNVSKTSGAEKRADVAVLVAEHLDGGSACGMAVGNCERIGTANMPGGKCTNLLGLAVRGLMCTPTHIPLQSRSALFGGGTSPEPLWRTPFANAARRPHDRRSPPPAVRGGGCGGPPPPGSRGADARGSRRRRGTARDVRAEDRVGAAQPVGPGAVAAGEGVGRVVPRRCARPWRRRSARQRRGSREGEARADRQTVPEATAT